MDLKQSALDLHAVHRGKIGTHILTPIQNKQDLSLAYTPGVAEVSKVIASDKAKMYDYTLKGHTVAVISDGSAVLGLGNIGPEGALPVMEGKAALFKTFANIDAFPLCLNTQNSQEIISIVKAVAPVFGGINLEDIAAPRCFEIENALQDLGIPVMHDDQHGTAVVVLAGLLNAVKLANKSLNQIKVVVLGAGAAGNAIARILVDQVANIILLDSKGIISTQRTDLDPYKQAIAKITNHQHIQGSLQDALTGADVFIGVAKANLLSQDDIKLMAEKAIVFALSNPTPEIMPDLAQEAGAFIVATGRSDFSNQINNSLAFPGIFKGALQSRATQITAKMKVAAAQALAALVADPSTDKIIPGPFDPGVADAVAQAVINSK